MPANAKRGAYYKARSKRWLSARGFDVADLELVRMIFTPEGVLPVKRDQLGSDLLAVSPRQIIFVQVKSGNRFDRKKAAAAFAACRFPPTASRCVHYWRPGTRDPQIEWIHQSRTDDGAQE